MDTVSSASSASPARIHAIVPAGGAGTRLWPLSRRQHPKFLLDLTGTGRSLLQATVARLAPVAATTTVVTGTAHLAAVADQLPSLPREDILAEPSPRDSMAAIGLAAAVVAQRHGREVVVGSFAADHVITKQTVFVDVVRQAAALAEAGWVATIGIEATGPSTAFGYIRTGDPLGVAGAPGGYQVLGFTEKPDAATAAAYLADGGYRWNAGMFVARAGVLLDHLAAQRPALAAGIEEIARAWDTPDREEALATLWPGLEKVAIDHAIAEPVAASGGVAVVPASMGWDDVGGFDALAQLVEPQAEGAAAGVVVLGAAGPGGCGSGEVAGASRGSSAWEGVGRPRLEVASALGEPTGSAGVGPDDAAGGTPGRVGAASGRADGDEVQAGEVEAVDSHGALVASATGRKVVLLGVPGVVVVDTPDALLVTAPQYAQHVKGVVDRLAREGRDELL